jgi:hypothetical protein
MVRSTFKTPSRLRRSWGSGTGWPGAGLGHASVVDEIIADGKAYVADRNAVVTDAEAAGDDAVGEVAAGEARPGKAVAVAAAEADPDDAIERPMMNNVR